MTTRPFRWMIYIGSALAVLTGCDRLLDSHLDVHGNPDAVFPTDVPFAAMDLPSGDRHLVGIHARSPEAAHSLILIFHGNGEAVGDWSAAQAFLFHHGFGSLVFDYSGFGRSTGSPGIEHMQEDGRAAYAAAVRLAADRPSGVFVLAHSLGCNVALDAIADAEPQPTGYAFWGCMASIRAYVARTEQVPAPLLHLIPDRWDNLRNIGRIPEPVLVLHGAEDREMTEADSRALTNHAAPGSVFLSIPEAGHNALYLAPELSGWGPIMDRASILAATGHTWKTDVNAGRISGE